MKIWALIKIVQLALVELAAHGGLLSAAATISFFDISQWYRYSHYFTQVSYYHPHYLVIISTIPCTFLREFKLWLGYVEWRASCTTLSTTYPIIPILGFLGGARSPPSTVGFFQSLAYLGSFPKYWDPNIDPKIVYFFNPYLA